jgi:hypothetical protein
MRGAIVVNRSFYHSDQLKEETIMMVQKRVWSFRELKAITALTALPPIILTPLLRLL